MKVFNVKAKKIISPISGVIAKQFIKVGEQVTSGAKAFEVITLNPLYIEIDVEAPKAQMLKLGDKIEFTTELHGGRQFQANLYYKSPVIDKSSGTVKIKLNLKNKLLSEGNYELKPGTLIKLSI